MIRTVRSASLSLVAISALLASAAGASAQTATDGQYEFNTYCAVCHGQDGKGGGPFTMLLNKRVPDLTVLSKNNSSRFPAMRVYDIIAGTADVSGHGSREMPIWGDVFSDRALAQFGKNADPADTAAFVKMRINGVVDYVSKLQE